MLKGYFFKKMIKTNKKNQLCEILSQKKKKKKPKPNQTNVIVPWKLEEIFFQTKKKKKNGKSKVEKDKKLVIGWRMTILSNSLFLIFSPFWRD